MASKNDLNNAQQLVRQNKKACVANLCEIIYKKVMGKNGRIPYRFMNNSKDSHSSIGDNEPKRGEDLLVQPTLKNISKRQQ